MDELNKQKPEVPIIIIERDEQPQPQEVVTKAVAPSRKQKWLKRFLALVAIGCLMVAILAGYYFWNYYYNIGVSVSVTPEQNIEKLQKPAKQETPEVVMTSDSILGVAMDFYAINGLKASIQFEEPDTADTSVYLYCRSVDHKADSTYIGTLVVNGEERQSDTHRLGYMAMLGGNSVIGISRSEKVKDYVQEHGGSFFRQFILVSNGDIPGRFFLHGKVERRAIGRIDDQQTTNSISSPLATRKPSGTLPMPSGNMASSMPSISQAVQIMCSIVTKMASGMISVISQITPIRNGKG